MKQRVVTALLLIPPVLLALTSTRLWPIGLLALVLLVLGLAELRDLLKQRLVYAGVFAIFPVLFPPNLVQGDDFVASAAIFGLVSTVLGVIGTYLVCRAPRPNPNVLAILAAGWVIGPLESLLALHRDGIHGGGAWNLATPVLLATVPLWAGDTAAIFAGRKFGKHLLAPLISPKKTWEGSVANLLTCVAVALPLAAWIGYSPAIGLACGASAGVLGQAGDLFESYVKRQAGVKDSGNILPGHGGVLDRIDSILFTAPAIAVILLLR